MSDITQPVHLMVTRTYLAANDDRDAVSFGTRLKIRLWWTRDREDRGRVRMRQGQSPVRPWERDGGKGNGIKARRRRKAS